MAEDRERGQEKRMGPAGVGSPSLPTMCLRLFLWLLERRPHFAWSAQGWKREEKKLTASFRTRKMAQ